MIGTPVRHIAGQVGAEGMHVQVRTNPAACVSRFLGLASILGLLLMRVVGCLRPREESPVFTPQILTFWSFEQQASIEQIDSIIPAQVACQDLIPRPL
jgi:hypothetical protein